MTPTSALAALVAGLLLPIVAPTIPIAQAATGDGLRAFYVNDSGSASKATNWSNRDVVINPAVEGTCATGTITTLNQDWGTGAPSGCPADNFSAYFTGYILGPKTGTVNFTVTADDSFMLRIADTQVLGNFGTAATVTGSYNFTSGQVYPVQIFFYENTGGAVFNLKWDASGSFTTITNTNLGTTPAVLLDAVQQDANCQVGSSALCPAFSAQEIYNLYGTTTDGNYWILVGGSPTYQYVLMNRSLDNGGWVLAMKGTNTTTNFRFDDTQNWTTAATLNKYSGSSLNTPSRLGTSNTDAKYDSFNGIKAQRIRAIFPSYAASTYGGRYTTNNNYGFMWDESLSSLSPGPANSSYYAVTSGNNGYASSCSYSTSTLLTLFFGGSRCIFRTPAATYTAANSNTANYDPIGNGVFSSQNVYRWWGINYRQPAQGGSPNAFHNARWGFGWNENESWNEGSNDVTGGIGLDATAANSKSSGDHVGCCQTATGANVQMGFEIYVRKADPSLGSPQSFTSTWSSASSATLSWSAPAGVTAHEYVVQYKLSSASWDSSAATLRVSVPTSGTPRTTITGLTGTSYDFRVFARTLNTSTDFDTNSSSTAATSTLAYATGLTPTFGTPTYAAGTYTIPVTNYDANYTWTYTASNGTAVAGTPSGSTVNVTVTPAVAGQTATLKVDTSRTNYLGGTATSSAYYGGCNPTSATSGGYTTLTFSAVITCGWSVPANVKKADVLVVGGGGGGGVWVAGGGGGGAVTETLNVDVSAVGSTTITVGAGGSGSSLAAATNVPSAGSNGGSSSALGITAAGGGVGGSWTTAPTSGASGGGGTGNQAAASGTAGFSGGTGSADGYHGYPAGGGGGAGAKGVDAVITTNVRGIAGNGGSGKTSTITGSTYGGGGGAGCHGNGTYPCVLGTGTNGGGDGGGYLASASGSYINATSGANNTGGGGGGAGTPAGGSYPTAARAGGSGGSGVVVIRYGVPTNYTYALNGGTGSTPSSGTAQVGSSITLAASTGINRANYTFAGWSDGASTYSAGGSYTMTATTSTFTAQWTATNYTVTYSANTGGSNPPATQTFAPAGSPTSVTISAATGMVAPSGTPTFVGWNTATDGTGTWYQPGGTYSTAANLALYAIWSCGTVTTSGVYTIVSFTSTSTCNWIVPNGVQTIDVLVVGGGGGGGSRHAGGGGGGGVIYTTGYSTTQYSTIAVTVGAGGSGAPGSASGGGGANGSSSSFGGASGIVANGGGVGGSNTTTAGNGGSGGGSAHQSSAAGTASPGSAGGVARSGTGISWTVNGGTATVNAYGSAGATGLGNGCITADNLGGWCGGGGGGASAAGTSPAVSSGTRYRAGNGGAGVAIAITGTSVTYGGGGGAGAGGEAAYTSSTICLSTAPLGGLGGAGGGGNGATCNETGANGTANTGGGGGGGSLNYTSGATYQSGPGGSGGSGVVIVRYVSSALTPTFSTPSPTSNGFTVNVTNYDPTFTFTPTVSAGFVTKGTASGSTLPLTVTGLSSGASATVTVATSASGFNGSGSVSSTAYSALSVPTNLTATATAGVLKSIGLTWTPTANATSYTIRIYSSGGSLLQTLSGVTGTSKTITTSEYSLLADNTQYQFSITGVGTGYNDSAESTKVSATTQQQFTVTYSAATATSGSASPTSATFITGGTGLTLATVNTMVKSGYTFSGWSTSSGGTANVSSPYTPTASITLYAAWTGNQYLFDGNTASGSTSALIYAGTALTAPSETFTDPSGYSFNGWCTTQPATVGGTCTGTPYSVGATLPTPTSATVTLYAVWVGNQYVYNANTGTGTTASQTYAGVQLTARANGFTPPTGYAFAGWCSASLASVSATCSGTTYAAGANIPTPASATVTLYAIWTRSTYSITYNANGGTGTTTASTFNVGASTTFAANSFTAPASTPTFVAWNTASDATGTWYTPTTAYSTQADLTVYAIWNCGTVTTSGGYTIVKFTSGCTWYVPSGVTTADILVVGGGGGGGGFAFGGGGGGGEVLYGTARPLTPLSGTVVQVGAGGAGGANTQGAAARGTNGDPSKFGTITALGGGGGGGYGTTGATNPFSGLTGGSGGGSAGTRAVYYSSSSVSGTSSTVAGFTSYVGNSGASTVSSSVSGSGGGGAGGAGQDSATQTPGAGGAGVSLAISGASAFYGAGGGGGTGGVSTSAGGAGGSSIGGTGGRASSPTPTAGAANTGSGGGGTGYNDSTLGAAGGSGGSGIVIIRYVISALTPTFDTPANITSTGFTVNVTNYNPSYTFTPSVSSGNVVAGTPSGSTLPLTITGLTSGVSTTVTMTVTANGTTGSATVSATPINAALTPTFSAPTSTAGGFTFTVTNFDSAYNWSVSVSSGTGTASINTTTGVVTVTGMTNGATSTVKVDTTRTNYTSGTASTTGTSQSILATPATPTVMATASTLKSIGVTWTAVTNASTYTMKIYDSTGATVLQTISGLTGTSKTVTASDFSSIADATTYQISLIAVASGYVDSLESAKASVTTKIAYTVTYALGGGTGTAPTQANVAQGQTFTVASDGTFSRSGYTFSGWKDGSNVAAAAGSTYTAGAANITLTAQWTGVTYTITYKAGANGSGSDLTQTFTYPNSTTLKDSTAALTRNGYSIGGWTTTDGGAQTHALSASYSSASPLTLYPVWTKVYCTVTTDTTSSPGYTILRFKTVGYCFWSNSTGATSFDAIVVGGGGGGGFGDGGAGGGAGELLLTDAPISLSADSETLIKVGAGGTSGAPNGTSTNAGSGWTYGGDGSSSALGTVTANGGGGGGGTNRANGATGGSGGGGRVNASGAAGAAVGSSYTGWTSKVSAGGAGNVDGAGRGGGGGGAGGEGNKDASGVKDLSRGGTYYTTVWGEKLAGGGGGYYTANAGGNGSEGTTAATVLGGNARIYISATTALIYQGNSQGVNGTGTGGGAGAPGGSGVVILRYANSQTITYNTNLGTGTIANGTGNTGSSVTLSDGTGFTRSSYTLSKWNTAANGTGTNYALGASITMPAGGLTLYAIWVSNSFTITYKAGTGATGSDLTQTFTPPASATLKDATAALTRTGYAISGWSLTDGGVQAYALSATYSTASNLTLYPVWTGVTYTITYKAGTGATGTDLTQTFIYPASATLKDATAALTKSGYSITGWSTTDGGTQTNALSASYSTAANLTLYPVWGGNTYTITYKAGTGATGSDLTQTFTYPASATLKDATAALNRTGYRISGWSTTDGGAQTNALSASYATASNLTLYPVWTALQYTVTYSNATATSGSPSAATSTFTYGGSGVTLATVGTMVKTGHDFSGWSTTSGGAANVTGPYSPSGDITLYAAWTPQTYTVTFDSQLGSSVSNGSFTYGGTVAAPTAPTRSGYNFAGWFLATTGGSALTFPYAPGTSSNLTLFARWTAINYTVTYALNGGTGTAPTETSKNVGNTFAVAGIGSVVKNGYTFTGWNDGTNNYNAAATYTVGTQNITLTAQWQVNVYTITYNVNGATGTTSRSSESYTYGSPAINLPTAGTMARSGYSFGGWSTSGNAPAISGTYTPTSTVTLKAIWSPNTYTVRYALNGGTGTVPSNASYTTASTSVTLPDSSGFSRLGYNLTGWSDGTTTFNTGASFTTVSDVTLSAVWTVKSIAYTYSRGTAPADWVVPTSGSSNYATQITLASPASVTYTSGGSYAFAGWYDGTNTYQAGTLYRLGTTDVSLVAQWIQLFKVQFFGNGGTLAGSEFGAECDATSKLCADGTAISKPSDPSRSGYTFAGWKDQSGASILSSTWNISSTSYLAYAQWTPIAYTVTYDSQSGSTAPTETSKNVGQLFNVGAAVTRTGYTFNGWTTGGVTYAPGASIQVGTSNINFLASWTSIDYNVTYDVNGGTSSVPASEVKNYGNSVTLPATPTRAGYTFNGWSDGSGTTSALGTYSMPARDITFTAQWTAIDYTLTYDSKGGSTAPAGRSALNVGDTFTVGAAVTLASRNFLGWSDGSNTYFPGQTYTVKTSDIKLEAVWSGQLYTVTYANGGGTGSLPTESDHLAGDSVSVKSGTSLNRNGYSFAGWSDGSTTYQANDTFSMGSGPVTLTAQWTKNTIMLTFYANDGSATTATQSITADTATGLRSNTFTRTNYTFAGWSANSDGSGSSYSNGQSVTLLAPTSFHAKWTPAFLVQFNSGGGTSVASVTYTGTALAKPTDPTRAGYTFAGWTESGNAVSWTYAPSGPVTLVAQWSAQTFTVTFKPNGGSGTDLTQSITADLATALRSNTFGQTNFTFAGWSTLAGGGGTTYTNGQSVTLYDNLTLYAQWSASGYRVTYNANHANASVAKAYDDYALGGSAVRLPKPVRAGFTFEGWYDTATGGNKVADADTDYTPTSSKTLHARWTQTSLYGVPANALTKVGDIQILNLGPLSLSLPYAGGSISFTVPQGALPTNTTITPQLVGDLSRARSLINAGNYVLSMVISWLASDETVPDTASGKPISMTITNSSIKAGQTIYSILGNTVTVLGKATVDGTATFELQTDPEVVIASTKPDAPTGVTATSGENARSTVSWTAAFNGGSPITGYRVTSSGGQFCTTTGATSCVVTGLTNGTSYTFTVTATNDIGTSDASTASSAITPVAPLSAPTGISVSATSGSSTSLTVSFTANANADSTTYYVYSAATGGSSIKSGTITSGGVITGLTTGTTYYIALQSIGSGAYTTGSESSRVSGTPSSSVPTISLSAGATGSYGVAQTITATVSQAGTVHFKVGGATISGCGAVATSGGSATCSWTPSAVNASTSIDATLTPTDTNYATSNATTVTVNVGKATQSITFPALTDQQYGSGTYAISASASSGLSVSFTSTTTSKCTVSGSNVTLIAVGTCTIAADQAGNGNYDAASQLQRSFAITAIELSGPTGIAVTTVTGAATSLKVTFTAATNASSTRYYVYSAATGGSALSNGTITSGGTITGLTTGTTYYIALQSVGSGNYSSSVESSRTAGTPSSTTPTISISTGATGSYGVAQTITATVSQAGTVAFKLAGVVITGCSAVATSGGSATCSWTPNALNAAASISATLTPTDTNYASSDATPVSVNVGKAAQTITFPALSDKVMGGGSYTISATSSSSLAVTFTSTTTSTCTISGATITLVAAGLCTIAADQAGDTNNDAASRVTRSFTITAAPTSGGGTGGGGGGTVITPTEPVTPPVVVPPVTPPVTPVVVPNEPIKQTSTGEVIVATGKTMTVVDGKIAQDTIKVVDTTQLVTKSGDLQLQLQSFSTDQKPVPVDQNTKLVLQQEGKAAIAGAGFKSETTVKIWIFSDPTFLGEFKVDANGKFDASLLVLPTLPVGEHTLQINGVTPTDKIFSQSLPVIITAKPKPVDPTPVDPTPVTPEVPKTGKIVNTRFAIDQNLKKLTPALVTELAKIKALLKAKDVVQCTGYFRGKFSASKASIARAQAKLFCAALSTKGATFKPGMNALQYVKLPVLQAPLTWITLTVTRK